MALGHFTLESNHPSIQSETTLKAILSRCFSQFSTIFGLEKGQKLLADPVNQRRVFDTIFDSDSRAFVTEDCLFMLEHLDDHAKATLLAQAVAGLVMVFERLRATDTELTDRIFSRELQLFSECEERHAMLTAIGSSPILESCYMKSQIADLITQAVKEETHDNLPLMTIGEERLNDGVSWVSYRPCRDMGLFGGFTIMAIN